MIKARAFRRPGLAAVGASFLATLLPLSSAAAGPPYETDDPEPTELGHWEIYAFTSAEGRHGNVDGSAGLDLNYGPVAGVQLTATLPAEYSHDRGGWRSGAGDVELGVKYRFIDIPSNGVSLAIFPRVFLPTSTMADATNHARLLLPVWAQKEFGKTLVFGGGGFELNPGAGNRDFWLAGVAVTHAFSESVSLGGEATHQSADAVDGDASNSLGFGAVIKLRDPFSLLMSWGPSWSGGQTSYHVYAALGLNL
jgi:hypothetical protein